MCLMNEEITQAPMIELIIAAGRLDYNNPTTEQESHLREVANHCPACIMAALRQAGRWMEFDFKSEAKQWLSEHSKREDRYLYD